METGVFWLVVSCAIDSAGLGRTRSGMADGMSDVQDFEGGNGEG